MALSVCVIACNEERNLRRCLDSVAWAGDRVVVVDERSRDATLAIARASGARVLVHRYEGNIEQKNFALARTREAWVLALDADEALSPELARAVREAVAGDGGGRQGFELDRVTFHLGRWLRHGDFHPDWQLRLFRREAGRWAGVNPHGRVVVEGDVGRLAGELRHWSYRDLADQVQRIQEFSRVQAAALRARGRSARLSDLLLRPPARLLRALVLRGGWRDGMPGVIVAMATAFHVFLKYAKLWELGALGGSEEGASGKAAVMAEAREP